jgi:hypothetical protein
MIDKPEMTEFEFARAAMSDLAKAVLLPLPPRPADDFLAMAEKSARIVLLDPERSKATHMAAAKRLAEIETVRMRAARLTGSGAPSQKPDR